MLPYLDPPVLRIGSATVTAFDAAVFAPVLVGLEVFARRAAPLGWDKRLAASLVAWTIVPGFIGNSYVTLR